MVGSASSVSLLILVRACWTACMESRDEEISTWLEREVAGRQFQDLRHGKRFRTLLGHLSEQIGGSIPFACQDWAATKAAYRFCRTNASAKRRFLQGISAARESERLRLTQVRCSSCMTQRSSSTAAKSLMRSESSISSRRAMTAVLATIRPPAFSCTQVL